MGIVRASPEAIVEAAALLRAGQLVAFPTETVYGLGADATNALAVAAVFEAKGRPTFNPLIMHVPSLVAAEALGHFTEAATRLANAFWPGPLTLVLRKRAGCPVAELATAGLDTIAVRVPAHSVARALLQAARVPIAAPSANRSGHVSPTTAAHVEADLGERVAMILDGGATPIGLESTVVDATGAEPIVLRLGAASRDDISRLLERPVAVATGAADAPVSPGMLARHYAPAARLRLNATDVQPDEALLAFGVSQIPPHAGPMLNLSWSGDLTEAAANLFSALRTLDAAGAKAIAVMPIPEQGLGEAINDRLRRAARPE
ncbi:MAG TPA: L-threonylcarbamoyladenylate synthase [Hyphomicrobiaceae bacterium]|nr:L-threonylcarbamoyladenylate synthase [Hyphomicrobiaceae bacterium]